MNIVVVDDDPIALELLRESLLADGHEVHAADDGLKAAELLAAGRARVLISDWEMPGMSGPELCRAIRSRDMGRYVYCILLTSRGSREDLVEGLRAGADDFLIKPFDPLELSVRLSVAERITSLETRDLMIFGMAKLAESRDADTGSHLERVRLYCRVLAEHLMGQPEFSSEVDVEFVRNIYMTSPLHDIGKVGIPDAILLKVGKLSPEEMRVMQTHTEIGKRTLEAALAEFPEVRFLEMARDVAWCHHERWDGSGYPRGLAGEDIPLAGRILAVADVYDALRVRRVYKPAMTHEAARAALLSGAATHFDPKIVATFLACEERFMAIAQSLEDQEQALELNAA